MLLYDQKFNTFANAGGAAKGSVDRIGTGYDGIGPNSVDGTAVPWMHAWSSPGFLGSYNDVNGNGVWDLGEPTWVGVTEFEGHFNPNALISAPAGYAEFYVDVDPAVGQGGAWYAPGDCYTGTGGETADLRFIITVTANNPLNIPAPPGGGSDWTVTTTDDVDGFMVPEPVTMAGLLLGIGCLGRYVRKRR